MASISCVVESRDFLAFTSAVLGNFPHLINLLKEFLVMILSIMTQFSYSCLVVNLEKALLPNAYKYIYPNIHVQMNIYHQGQQMSLTVMFFYLLFLFST